MAGSVRVLGLALKRESASWRRCGISPPVIVSRFFLLAAAALGSAASAAAEESKPVSLDYRADAGCPTKNSFVAQVLARTGLVRIVAGQADVPRVSVLLRETGEGAVGTVQVGSGAPRSVSDGNCVDVVAALALISALTLDPAASTAALPKSPAEPSEAAGLTASPPAASEADKAPRGLAAQPSPPKTAPASLAANAEDRPTRRLQVASWEPRAVFDVSRGFSDDAIIWLGARAGAMADVRLGQSPIGRIGADAVFYESPRVTPALGSATFQVVAARLNVCPPALARGRIALIPCVAAEIGRLSADGGSGRGVVSGRDIRRTWLAAAQSLGVELTLREPYYLTLAAELREPLRTYRFIFENPETPIATVPRLEIGGALGAGVRL